jgi:hypothetical protein
VSYNNEDDRWTTWTPMYAYEWAIFELAGEILTKAYQKDIIVTTAWLSDYYCTVGTIGREQVIDKLQELTRLDNFQILKLINTVDTWKKEETFSLDKLSNKTAEARLKRFIP